MKNLNHIMLDLETMGNGPTSVIVSLGAVMFDPMGDEPLESLPRFYRNIDIQSCLDAGLKVDGSTIEWWMKQSDEARKALFDPTPKLLYDALIDFRSFFYEMKGEYVWSHATFDAPILSNAYRAVTLKQPWSHRNTRDIRTLVDLSSRRGFPEIESGETNKLVHHKADDDCLYQVSYVRERYQFLDRNSGVKEEAAA